MKLLNALTACLVAFAITASAQTSRMMMPAVSSPAMADDGTELGANTTLTSSGIALGNRVKMRGFVDFRYDYNDLDNLGDDDARFRSAADLDFLIDFSPVTGEVHFAASSGGVNLEQAFLRYNFNQDFSLTAGRQLTVLGFEKDEAPNMYQTSYAYLTDVAYDLEERGGVTALEEFVGVTSLRTDLSPGLTKLFGSAVNLATAGLPYTELNKLGALTAAPVGNFDLPSFRRNYVDGIRLNFNNGQFGFVAGIHNGYFTSDDNLNDGNIGIDIAASVMIVPGLEFRLGFGYENNDDFDNAMSAYNSHASQFRQAFLQDVRNDPNLSDKSSVLYNGMTNSQKFDAYDRFYKSASMIAPFPEADDISQINFLLSYQTGGLTLAFEWDLWNVYVIDMWNLMFLANYQFNDVFGLTFRYSHEDFEADVPGGGEGSSNRFTIGPMFSVTDNLTVGIEYSHAELDSTNTGDTSVDELYAETIFSF
tara:strand:- start:336 stop:1769 length:1434 start_codon:yes stop_codon:yes gene_type:complete